MSRRRDYNSLTPKEARFVEEYLIDLNGAAAARRAGYAAKSATVTASKLLSKPNVAAAIAQAKQLRSEAAGVDAQWVLERAIEVYKRCFQDIAPALHPKTRKQMKDSDGNPLFVFQSASCLRALEIIGRHVEIGAFADRVEVTAPGMDVISLLNAGRARVGELPIIEATSEPMALPTPSRKPRLPLPAEGAVLVTTRKEHQS